jgi:hypothetical protein
MLIVPMGIALLHRGVRSVKPGYTSIERFQFLREAVIVVVCPFDP